VGILAIVFWGKKTRYGKEKKKGGGNKKKSEEA
jgi:hypothetical protein